MDLYHADIRLPEGFVAPTARVNLVWTRHADHARTNDRYGVIPKFSSVSLSRFSVIEVGMESGKVAKIVMRGKWTDTLDVVLVLIPTTRSSYTVKTVWVNEANDTHKTLNRSKYVA